MKTSLSDIYRVHIETHQVRSGLASALLFLLCFTCIIEHLPLVETDFVEIIEGAEKEVDLKDKPLLYNASLSDIQGSLFIYNTIYTHIEYPNMRGVYLDVSSPPPRFI